MKTGSAIARIIIFSVTLAILGAVLAGALGYGFLKDLLKNWEMPTVSWNAVQYDEEDAYEKGDREIRDPALSGVVIHWIAGSVTVDVTDGNKLICRETGATGDEDAMRTRLKDGVLTVQFAKSGYKKLTGAPQKALTLLIPEKLLEDLGSLAVESVTADVTVTNIAAGAWEIEQVSGDVVLSEVKGEKLTVETVSGDLSFSGAMEEMETESVSGDVKLFFAAMPASLSCESVSGDAAWALPEEDFKVKMDKVSGGFTSDIACREENGWRVAGKGGPAYTMETVSGDLTITKYVVKK